MSRCRRFTICFACVGSARRSAAAGDDGRTSRRLKKKKPIRNCQRGGNTSHHITSQRRRCFNFTFSNATYLHPLCLKRPLLNFTALLCQFANWSKTTADVNLILGGSDDGVSGMEFIFLNGVCSLGGLNKEYFSQNSAYERNNTR